MTDRERKSPFRELNLMRRGAWGAMTPIEEDASLTGLLGIRTFNKIRRDDPTGTAMYWALTLPIRNVAWRCEPGGEKTRADEEAAEFAWSAFNDMSLTFDDLISDVCQMFIFGWSYFRMVMKRRNVGRSEFDDGRVGFRKIKAVPHLAFQQWEFDEESGDVAGLTILAHDGPVTIWLDEALLFRTSREADDPNGISIYRPAVRPWKYKRRLEKVEGIGLYRRWAGFPQITLPQNATTRKEEGERSDEARAEEIVKAIYEDRLMGFHGPPGWEITLGGPEGTVDTTMNDTIIRKDAEMTRAILAQWLLLGLKSVGTQALAGTLLGAFELSIGAFLAMIADEINRYAIPYLFKFNRDAFPGMTGLPQMVPGDPRSVDLKAVAIFLRSLSQAGLLSADWDTEDFLRSLVPGMPTAKREEAVEAPQVVKDEEGQTPEGEDEGGDGDESEDDEEGMSAPPSSARRRVETFAAKPAPGRRARAYHRLADAHAAAQRANLENWAADAAGEIADLPEETSEATLREKLDDLVLAGLLLFHERSVLDIAAAFWLGFGKPSGGSAALMALQQEVNLADQWMGYNAGELREMNPAGKPTLFGDVAGTLEGRIAAILLLLKQGKPDEVYAEVVEAVKAATQGFARGELYAGHVWHAVAAGSVARMREDGYTGPVRWVLDVMAQHCPTCLRFGQDPPGREYPSLDALLGTTGGILPGYGTECDGRCRCHLEKMENGRWVWA